VAIFFLADDCTAIPPAADQTLAYFVTGGTVRGEPRSLSDAECPLPTGRVILSEALEQLPTEFNQYVVARMFQHTSQTLVAADDEVL